LDFLLDEPFERLFEHTPAFKGTYDPGRLAAQTAAHPYRISPLLQRP
jgi:hypothetical protein